MMQKEEGEYHKELAKVKDVRLMLEDHGILMMYIELDYGRGASQGFGGYALDTYDKKKKRRIGTAAGLDYILRILNLFNVSELPRITGRPVYALKKKDYEPDIWSSNMIIGLETPSFDGGKRFLIKDWQKDWGYDKEK